MTAYGAVISLNNTTDYILHSSHISLVEPSLQIIQLAYNELLPLQLTLRRLDVTRTSRSRKKVNALDGRIKDLIWEFEDKLEFLLTDQILSQIPAGQIDEEMTERVWEFESLLESLPSQQLQFQFQSSPAETSNIHGRRRLVRQKRNGYGLKSRRKSHASQSRSSGVGGERDVLLFSIDLQSLQADVGSMIETLKEMEKEYIYEVKNMAEDDEAASSIIGFDYGGTNTKMIGLSDQFEKVKSNLMSIVVGKHSHGLVGMAGIGKTTLAKKIFEDAEIVSRFGHRAWITVGRKPKVRQLSRGIVAQLRGNTQGDENIGDYLKGEKCIIVLDDVWERRVLNSLKASLPDIKYALVLFLITARDLKVITDLPLKVLRSDTQLVRFLNDEESKELLCEKVFGEEICPPQLDKAATKIAKKCEGLPLLILTVADILSKSAQNRDPDYWNDAAEERNSVFMDAYNQISKVLFPSYDYLPQYLKMPFLFMGVFPKEYDTPPSKIINMFTAEGWFRDTNGKQYSLNESIWKCLEELCMDKNLVLFNKRSIISDKSTFLTESCFREHYFYKTCRLHSSWRHICRGEASKNKFYHVLKRLVDAEEEGLKGQRGLCLENNILFGIKEFRNSVRLNCASSTRSLLFYGPYHQYPIPIDVGFKLLREIDALTQRLYTFPIEILTLVQLKYLALTCNGELPTTISKLLNLQVLIIHPHMNIRRCRAPSYVPAQIWDMQELEHIEILGKSLRAPYDVASLKKLSALVGVNASICTILELSKRIPNIRKLGVQIELTPYDDHNDLLHCFRCISTLGSLEILKCSIINPVAESGFVFPATPSSLMLPRGLKKLHLSGMGFPWEYMDVVGSLPFLQVLKLRSYAFQGSKWETQVESFLKLEFLLIEDSDLVQWRPRSGSFHKLGHLSMKHCYKVQKLHWLSFRQDVKIEFVDCNPLALTCAKQFKLTRNAHLDVIASSTFDEKPTTIKLRRYGPIRGDFGV